MAKRETREFKLVISIDEPKVARVLQHTRKCSLVIVPGEKTYAREFLIRELGLAFADALSTLAVVEGIDP